MRNYDYDVVVVGAGPAGLTLANLLGEAGISVIVLERNEDIIDHARAVGIDDEAIRTLQTFGMAETILENSLQNAPIRYYDSHGKILAHVAPSVRPYGWPRRNLFHQPFLETKLRESLRRFPAAELRVGHEVVGLDQDDTGVTLRVRSAAGSLTVRARYVVGADGGRSFVRDAIGVELRGNTAPIKWLVVDVEKDTWNAPYSAVYTSPDRPSMTIPLPFGLRRFEFQIKEHEDPDRFAEIDNVNRLLSRFYPNSSVPPVARSRVYWHHSRTASSFQVGRAFLVGDAAHLQPPFFGQGMNSGIRDVTNLYWKLAAVVSGKANPGILGTYDSERRNAADDMVQFATQMGRYYKPRNAFTERVRNVLFRGVQKVPGGRDYILQMKYKPAPRYTDGLVVAAAKTDSRSLAGKAFPQPWVQTAEGDRRRLDDVIGARIAVIGLVPHVADAISDATLDRLHAHRGIVLQSSPARVYQREGLSVPPGQLDRGVVEVIDVDGGLRDMLLACPGDQVYIVRPDRYVAAVCTVSELDDVLRQFICLLDGGRAGEDNAPAAEPVRRPGVS